MICLYCSADISHKRKGSRYCNSLCSNNHRGEQLKESNRCAGKYITCIRCNQDKSPNDFSYNIRNNFTSGKKPYCKRCGANERETIRRDKTWKSDAARVLLNNSRQRAKSANIEHTITIKDIDIPDKCPIFGYELKREDKKTWKQAPSIDRIDNTKGYTKDNIIIVSRRANILKKDATPEELQMLSDFYNKKV